MTTITDAVRNSMIFSGLPDPLIQRIAAMSSLVELAPGNTIFVQGEPAEAVFLVVDGWVKLYRVAVSGAEAVVTVRTRGHSFAEAIALRGKSYPVSAEAVTQATLVRIDAKRLRHLIETEPPLALAMLASCYVKLQGFVTQVEQLKARSGAQRVAEFLLSLCDEEADKQMVELPYNKGLIAGRLGIKPESLSRAFRRLRDHGVRIEGNRAYITDMQAVVDFIADDARAG
ncbi:MAG: Crp/Fnr family transcriptional regulator [Paracoccus sp. (in: a-proteobacteria)]|nr:Crp/Fnr family transcriptional regulator [Paracoccus sp. (in: a-proteobacteria)]